MNTKKFITDLENIRGVELTYTQNENNDKLDIHLNRNELIELTTLFNKENYILNFITAFELNKSITCFYQFTNVEKLILADVFFKVEKEKKIPSIGQLYKIGYWFEVEINDLFGLKFNDHDLGKSVLFENNIPDYAPLLKNN